MQYGKKLGVGNTATVYEWKEDKVLKLFHQGYPREAVEKEFNNARMINSLDFAKAKAYELISCEEQLGIIYDKLEGETLLDWVLRTGDVEGCAVHMAKLHKQIIRNKISNIPNYKEFLKDNTVNLPMSKQKEVLNMLDNLSEANTLCHGDFHPGNIFISNDSTMIIDFMNVCHGDYLYDVARTVFLIEYTPVPRDSKEREMIIHLKKTLVDLYLIQMEVTREMIQDYLSVIIICRMGECPDEG